jgi:hypothetical protein
VEYLAFLKLDVPRRRMLASSLTHSHQKANIREPTAVDISAASAEISAAKGSVQELTLRKHCGFVLELKLQYGQPCDPASVFPIRS